MPIADVELIPAFPSAVHRKPRTTKTAPTSEPQEPAPSARQRQRFATPAAPAALPEPTAADIAAAEQMLANMRKKREKERTTNAAVSTPKNDGQMFAQVVQGNKPRVRLPSGEVISCDKLNPYAAPTWAEGWCLVMVTPLGGKPLKAEFKRWQKQGEIAPNSSTGG